ncbi:MAG: DUF2723 domain-containing protein [Chloroflexota bacterium]
MLGTRRFPYLLLLILIIPAVYIATLARTVVWGDPTEYTFVANILGIAHPPGYAFYTLLGKLAKLSSPSDPAAWPHAPAVHPDGHCCRAFVHGAVAATGRKVLRR